MVTITLGRRDRKKLETRERILRAGLAAFTEKGIDVATIDEIAVAADVGKGTVYNYFQTKEDIVVAFLIDIERQAQNKIAKLTGGRGSLETILTRFIQVQFTLKEPHHPFVRVFLGQLCSRATPESQWLQEIQTVMDPPLIQLFTALQHRALIRGDVDMDTLVGTFKVMQLGLTVIWALEGPPWAQMPAAIRAQVRLYCSGIEAKR